MERRNVGICILLTILTCGIYGIYWFIKLCDDTNQISGIYGTSGGVACILNIVTCGIYGLYAMYVWGDKIDRAYEMRGGQSKSNAIIYLVLGIFGFSIISYALCQNELNNLNEGPYIERQSV